MTNFRLVNPYIEGDFNKVYSGKTAQTAARNVWENLSKHITNNVPKFAFTLERVNDGELFHYMIQEKSQIVDGNMNAQINLSEIEVNQKNIAKFCQ